MTKKFLAGSSVEELKSWLTEHGESAFRAKQIADWLYGKLVFDPFQMKNIPAKL